MRTDEALDQFWQNEAYVIRAFLDVRPSYAKLGEEVSYILEKRLRSADVEYAAVTRIDHLQKVRHSHGHRRNPRSLPQLP